MTAFDKAFAQVQTLVQKFDRDIKHYMSAGYSEAEARQDFIDNFFIALGWDVNHQTQTNPYEQEVKIERSQKQQNESARKRADYAFFLAPNHKDEVFFVEAKKPSVLIQNQPQHYFQTQRYGWNAGCPISALTDFEEFVIIDCRAKPDIKYALNGKHKSYRYTDYANKEKFGEIYWVFSREAVAAGSIKKFADSLPKAKGKIIQKALFKGGYQAIDDSFLEYIDGIRLSLAQAFKKNDDSLDGEQLTEAVQRTVDRLVFIRFLKDKFIEAEQHVNEWTSWKDFVTDCRKLDAKYNGVVFKKHFIDEQDFAGAEAQLFVDICQDISSLNSPYDFNYIPIHILGSIYERFLGKVIRTTAKRVMVEEKPEVRKAGGVYYTPKYIVDYIVQNTVGKQIAGKTPKQIAELHFADIACGSGSFLIGVYDCLLDYHKKYYLKELADKTEINKNNAAFGNVEYINNQWVLSLKLKQDILLNNIYGVDIDYQAVEVTQLSLFLKMLEDESLSSIGTRQGRMFAKVLPDLTKNIVCGNSLIGFDIMSMNGGLFEDNELKKLNPMDYASVFPKIMRNGVLMELWGIRPM
jgi:adenine-specific DNA-methyltransferase